MTQKNRKFIEILTEEIMLNFCFFATEVIVWIPNAPAGVFYYTSDQVTKHFMIWMFGDYDWVDGLISILAEVSDRAWEYW